MKSEFRGRDWQSNFIQKEGAQNLKRKNILYFASLLALAMVVAQSLSTRLVQAQTFTVTTTADNGNDAAPTPGSLRAAIVAANDNGEGADTINFNIPGSGVKTINLSAQLPEITTSLTIN